jgi:hypothetical protein
MDLMIRLKELQRRMDQILGVPKMNERDRAKHTINARLTRLEDQISCVVLKLDECLTLIRSMADNKVDQDQRRAIVSI